jgi:hypothetical protein
MNSQVDRHYNHRNHQEQWGDAQAVSQTETYHPEDYQKPEKRLQHTCVSPAKPIWL